MRRRPLFHAVSVLSALSLAGAAGMVAAQSDDAGGAADASAPVDLSSSFEVTDIHVDTTGPTADAARFAGWREAQRKGWQKLSAQMTGGASSLSDSALDAMVTGIVIENEQIGPNRYVARLGVMFSRARAAPILGVAGVESRSRPMLTIPIMRSGGVAVAFEQKSPWADAWNRFRTADSIIDYTRPLGNGGDSLLLNEGQVNRRDRAWWRAVLDQYGSQDVLIPAVTLYRQWPGGPVIGVFEARHGPDNDLLGRFALRVQGEDGLPALLDAGVKRIDDIYQNAMRNGTLSTDSSLAYVPPVLATPTPTDTPIDGSADDLSSVLNGVDTGTTSAAADITIQFDSPSASSVSATESAVRGLPGVGSATTTSLAIGGVSVMRVSFTGDPDALRSALEARGFAVGRSGTTFRIRRSAPTLPPPAAAPDDQTTG